MWHEIQDCLGFDSRKPCAGGLSVKFKYMIDRKEVRNLDEKERMIWSLDVLQKSSVVREKYYKQHDAVLGPSDGYNPQLNQDNNLIRLIMVDLVFTLIRSIESFVGAVGVGWKISTEKPKMSAKSLHRWLLRPGDTLAEVREILSDNKIDKITLCKLCGFPVPDDLNIERGDQINLWRVYDETLKRIKTYGFFASHYFDEFKEVRNVYSHNMRFLFLNVLQSNGLEEADTVGLLGSKKRSPNYLLLICESQRKAIRELTIQLCKLERILYENLKFCVLNDCTPVPPASLVSIPDGLQDELVRIKKDLGFKWIIPSIRIEIRDNESIESQYQLHSDFLHTITELGD